MSPTGASPELPAHTAVHDMAARDARLAQLERMTRDLSSELAWANERLLAEMYDHNDDGDGALLSERNDVITGLPNRRSFEARAEQLLAAHIEESEPAALVLIALPRLQALRESTDLAACDRVLRVVADRLRRALRGADLIARLDEDMFGVLLAHLQKADDVEPVVRKILSTLSRPVVFDGHEISLTPAMGAARYPRDGADVQTLLAHAAAALMRAREDGGGSYQLFEPHLAFQTARVQVREDELRAAVERDEFCVLYQPRFDAGSGALTGGEALLRWRHPQRGLLGPADFLDLAESTGLIVPIGMRVLFEACSTAAEWKRRGDQGAAPLTLSVKLSLRELRGLTLPQMIGQALTESGLDAAQLHVELTESSLLAQSDEGESRRSLDALRALGVRIVLNGLGSASLVQLRRLPIDCVKIDGELVRSAPTDECDRMIVLAVAVISRKLGRRVVAAGVETEAQLALIRALHCDEVQGYLLGEPVDADRFAAWLDAGASVRAAD
jgi:diguanylate cyclase (GGDEF)-like protein